MYSIFEQLLQKYNVTTYKVSMETGISQSSLSAWKTGKSNLKQDKLELLADYFGVSMDYLMGRESEENNDNKYYLDSETIERLQSLKINDKLRILFDASRKLQPSDIDYVLDLVERLNNGSIGDK